VTSETTRFLSLLEERLALLNSLASALLAARTDIVSLDINGLESRITEQDNLCNQIRNLDYQLDRVQSQCTSLLSAPPNRLSAPAADSDSIRCRETLDRLSRVQANVKQLNDEHQVLLRRSRRTVSALLNSYHTFAITYANPSTQPVTSGETL
jgi:FlgN protein